MTVVSLLIKNGTVVNPAKKQNEVADVLVKDGKIAAIGQNLSAEALKYMMQQVLS